MFIVISKFAISTPTFIMKKNIIHLFYTNYIKLKILFTFPSNTVLVGSTSMNI